MIQMLCELWSEKFSWQVVTWVVSVIFWHAHSKPFYTADLTPSPPGRAARQNCSSSPLGSALCSGTLNMRFLTPVPEPALPGCRDLGAARGAGVLGQAGRHDAGCSCPPAPGLPGWEAAAQPLPCTTSSPPEHWGAVTPPKASLTKAGRARGVRSTRRGCACGWGSLPAPVLISFCAALAAASRRAQLRSGRGTSAVETWEELTIPKDWLHTRPSKSCWLPA